MYDIKESIYAGDGHARGIFEDPETLNYAVRGHLKTQISIVEIFGKIVNIHKFFFCLKYFNQIFILLWLTNIKILLIFRSPIS